MIASSIDSSNDPSIRTASRQFLERTPMRAVFPISPELLDQAMAVAFSCYQVGRYAEAELLCKGLLAADHRYWWAYSLYASVLRNQGRLREALVQLNCGLKYEPGQPKLMAMKDQLLQLITLSDKGMA
jgi:hypothetical protein